MGKRVGRYVGGNEIGTRAGKQARNTWIEDGKRPGGIGRSERERLFWERVASGRPSLGQSKRRQGPRSFAGRQTSTASIQTTRGRPTTDVGAEELDGRWESLRLAAVTMLTVIAFGLGWVTLELEGVTDSNRYAWLPGPVQPAASDLRAEFEPPLRIERSGYSGHRE